MNDLGGIPISANLHIKRKHRYISGPKKCFSSPRLFRDLIPRQNELSIPGMVKYLAYSSVWNAGSQICLFPTIIHFGTLNHVRINFQALAWWNIWPLALFWMVAPEKKAQSGPKQFVFLPCLLLFFALRCLQSCLWRHYNMST